MKTILLKVKTVMHCLHIEAKEVCIINGAQKNRETERKVGFRRNKRLAGGRRALLSYPAQVQKHQWNQKAGDESQSEGTLFQPLAQGGEETRCLATQFLEQCFHCPSNVPKCASNCSSKLRTSLPLEHWDVLAEKGREEDEGRQAAFPLQADTAQCPAAPRLGRDSSHVISKGRSAEAAWHMVSPIF